MGRVIEKTYRFQHFNRDLLDDDLDFQAGKQPGWSMPDFDLPTTDGGRVRKGDFMGRKPLLVAFASITCPVTASASPALRRLYREYGERVAFLGVYVREAHPGDHIRQPPTFEWKMRHARAWRARDAIPFPVAVDDLEGSFHRALGGNSSSVHIMDANGNVAFRTLWSNDERVIRGALHAIAAGQPNRPFEKERRLVPMARALTRMDDVVRAAGGAAVQDLRREAPLVYLASEIAWFFRTLTPLGRAAVGAAAALGMLAALGGARFARRRR